MTSLTPSTAKRESARSSTPSLLDKLATVLPKGYKFVVHHISTPPTKTEPLCSAPPGERPDKTFAEKHFLAVSIDVKDQVASTKPALPATEASKASENKTGRVQAFAIEVFIFTTAFQTTFFVSKADSTGYLQLLGLPKGTPSPIREVCSTFLAYLLEHRYRKNTQAVINLFARAQGQYLYPGSVDNKGKHVLDDWGLVRWWCRVLNPLLETHKQDLWERAKGYLIVPGLEQSEMRAMIPRTSRSAKNWAIDQPLERISHYTDEFDWVPPRCLIPKYPDDPKCRFRDELDEEASKWKENMGTWKSVKTLAQFWDMMAFRQECSSGRLTGFVWLVFDPPGKAQQSQDAQSTQTTELPTPNASFSASNLPPSTPPRRRVDLSSRTPQASPLKLNLEASVSSTPSKKNFDPTEEKKKKKKKLTGKIIPRAPRVKTEQRSKLIKRPTRTAYYYWPEQGRGEKVVDDNDFKRIGEVLLHLDFSTLAKATSSTRRWIGEAGMGSKWGQEVVGKRSVLGQSLTNGTGGPGTANVLGVVKRKGSIAAGDGAADGDGTPHPPAVNVMSSNLVKRKRKDSEVGDGPTPPGTEGGPKVNVLGVVKKKKADPGQ
ncbi:histone acetylation protein-domain-containing protein [Rhypophila decipiens]|uniref:histone acetyltransferase n=1 Tax=Rhypophila decipiens TaxID=261697 RepID=A0AAN6YAK7_9PEZI|nr:histone acetylation protein-domain-containing protein [Rhypophila decipiens]